jgi:hypothetical protein
MFQEEEKLNMKSIFLQLGDVFKITNSSNDVYNNESYYIEYIDSEKIKSIRVQSLDKVEFRITTELHLATIKEEKKIDGNIDLLFRNHYQGFVLQNKLHVNKWIQIIFDSKDIFIGEIIHSEKDMIEIELYKTKDKIYINFNYNGIPEDLSIKQIKIINKPSEYEGEVEENMDIEIIGEVEDIVQLLDVDVSKYRYDIEVQKTDLLNSMLSQLSSAEKTPHNLNNIHLNIERFQQLRKQFSTFDEYGNIMDEIYKGPFWKPLVNNLKTLKTQLSWIIPVTSTVKKVYGISEEDEKEFQFISNYSIDIDEKLDEIVQMFKGESSTQKSFRYTQYLQNLYNYFIPFENLDLLNPLLTTLPIQNNTSVIIDNIPYCISNVIKNIPLPKGDFYNKVEGNIFVRDVYLSGDKILDAYKLTEGKMFANRVQVPNTMDTINLTGLIILPETIVEYSRVKLPGTNILDKTNLSHIYLDYSKLFNYEIPVNIYTIDNKTVNQNFYDGNFIKKSQLNFFKPEVTGNYLEFLENIIPKSKNIFKLVKPYIIGKLSLVNIVHFLEPYLIYPDDVTYTFYKKDIVPFIVEKISEFNSEIYHKKRAFDDLFFKIVELNEKRLKKKLNITLSFSKNDLCEIYDITETVKHPFNDELLLKMTVSDFKKTYTYKIVESNMHLLIDSSIDEYIERQEANPCEELNKDECVSSEKCMDDKNECNSISNIAKNITKQNLDRVLSEFDKKYVITQQQLKEIVEREYEYSSSILQKVIQIEYNNSYGKYERIKNKLGEEANREMNYDAISNISPFIKKRDYCLGIFDLETKYNKILEFKEHYTYSVLKDYWFYCIKTNTKLLPTFIYELAHTFIFDRDNFDNKLHYIIKTQGVDGDDGESYVDKYSGYVIHKKFFDAAEGYNNGFKVITRDFLEEEEEEKELYEEEKEESVVKDRPYMKYEHYKLIIKTIDDLCSYLKIQLNYETKNDFIANIVYQQMILLYDEKKYRLLLKKQKDKEPLLDYNSYINRNLVKNTIATFLISLQTNIPNIILNENCCFMDFYPSNPDGSRDSIHFISKISFHLIKKREQPWISLLRPNAEPMKIDEIEKLLYNACDKIIKNAESNILIEQRKQLKVNAISKLSEETGFGFIPKKYKISNWKQFLPPLLNINIKTRVDNVSNEFIKSLNSNLTKGDIKQHDKINILEGKTIIFSLFIQQEIQNVINTEELKLKSLSGQQYLENSCCWESEKESFSSKQTKFIDYFIEKTSIINTYLELIHQNSLRLNDIKLLTNAPTLIINKNTKLKFDTLKNEFTENTIFMAFIKYCNFEKPIPIPDDFLSLCKCKEGKPDIQLFDLNDSIQEKVEKLKENGKMYTNNDLINLLQRVGYNNIIHLQKYVENEDVAKPLEKKTLQPLEKKTLQPLENVRMILHEPMEGVRELTREQLEEDINQILKDKQPLTKSKYLLQFINHWINIVDKKSDIEDSERDKINDDITDIINELIQYINRFLSKTTKIDKTINDFFKKIFIWKDYSSNFCNSIIFIKNYIHNISKVFPNIMATDFLQNGENSPLLNDIVHKYQGLSSNDLSSIKKVNNAYYQRFIKLNELINGDNDKVKSIIVLIMNRMQEDEYCNKIIELMNQTPIFSESNSKDCIFDNKTTKLLFSFYFLTIFSTYIKITYEVLESVEENPSFKDNIKIFIIHLLINYMNMMDEDKKTNDFLYKNVFDKEFKFKEIEKGVMIERLQQMTNEARKADNNLKAHRLGIWGKGLSDKVFKYTAKVDIIDTAVLKKTKQVEEKIRHDELIRDVLMEQQNDDVEQYEDDSVVEDEVEHGDDDESDLDDGNEYDEYDDGEEYNDRDRDE